MLVIFTFWCSETDFIAAWHEPYLWHERTDPCCLPPPFSLKLNLIKPPATINAAFAHNCLWCEIRRQLSVVSEKDGSVLAMRRQRTVIFLLLQTLLILEGESFELQDTIHTLIEENIHLHDQLENLTQAFRELKRMLWLHSSGTASDVCGILPNSS